MAVVGKLVLSNILGSSSLHAAVTIQHNCCAKSAKSCTKYSLAAGMLKMVNPTVDKKTKICSMAKNSNMVYHPEVSDL